LSSPYLGEIRLFSFNFAPKGWAFCNGNLLSISQYQALFALLGTYYGGNGIQNFALPDLRSKVPLHMGSGGGSTYNIGETGGAENVTLLTTELPTHNHLLQAVNAAGATAKLFGHNIAQSGTTYPRYAPGASNVVPLNPASIQPAGGSTPHGNIQPYLSMNYCIAMQGIFPSRS
jgi:microcystin-dependent protein